MLKVIQSPAKYLQGPDAAVLFGQYAKNLAESFFVIADDFVMKLAGEKVVNGLQSHDIRCHAERFNGECSHAEINRLMAILQKQGCRGVVGIGGGKTLDTAKAIGYYQKLPEAAGGGDPDHRLDRCANQRAVGDLHRSGRV